LPERKLPRVARGLKVEVRIHILFSKSVAGHQAGEVMQMNRMESKSLNNPDEKRTFDKGKLEIVNIGDRVIGRATLQPGWRWSESVKPLVKTESCEAPHFQYHVSGTLRVKMDGGKETDFKAGDVSLLEAGHDAWVVGDEPVVVVDFQGMVDYAKGSGKK
jgi:hypothetical protein